MDDFIVVDTCIPLSLSRVLADSQFTVIKGVFGFASWGRLTALVCGVNLYTQNAYSNELLVIKTNMLTVTARFACPKIDTDCGGRQVMAVPSSLTSSPVQGWPPTVTE